MENIIKSTNICYLEYYRFQSVLTTSSFNFALTVVLICLNSSVYVQKLCLNFFTLKKNIYISD